MRCTGSTHQLSHQTSGCKISVKEPDNECLGQDKTSTEDSSRRCSADVLPKCVETSRRHHKPANDRGQRQQVDSKKHSHSLGVTVYESHDGFRNGSRRTSAALGWEHHQVRIVHGPKVVRVLGFVLLDVCGVYPLD